jgi:hypothetical protein
LRLEKTGVEEKYREFKLSLPKQLKIPLYSPEKKEEKKFDDKENIQAKPKEVSVITKGDVIQITNLPNEKTDVSTQLPSEVLKEPIAPKRYKPPKQQIEKITATTLAQPLKKPKEEKKEQACLKQRIRLNKYNKLVIDRYIQAPNSFAAFDDDFNRIINKFKIYNEDFVNKGEKQSDFNSPYADFLKKKFSGIVPSDSEEENSSYVITDKTFGHSYKQFLKHKRAHPEVSS